MTVADVLDGAVGRRIVGLLSKKVKLEKYEAKAIEELSKLRQKTAAKKARRKKGKTQAA